MGEVVAVAMIELNVTRNGIQEPRRVIRFPIHEFFDEEFDRAARIGEDAAHIIRLNVLIAKLIKHVEKNKKRIFEPEASIDFDWGKGDQKKDT